jgi:hypothetical protein
LGWLVGCERGRKIGDQGRRRDRQTDRQREREKERERKRERDRQRERERERKRTDINELKIYSNHRKHSMTIDNNGTKEESSKG